METNESKDTRRNVDGRGKRLACVGGTCFSRSLRYPYVYLLFSHTGLRGTKKRPKALREDFRRREGMTEAVE